MEVMSDKMAELSIKSCETRLAADEALLEWMEQLWIEEGPNLSAAVRIHNQKHEVSKSQAALNLSKLMIEFIHEHQEPGDGQSA